MSPRPVLVLAGGTGGHVFPALAVAEVLRERAVPVHWLGGESGIEKRVVPAAGFAFTALPGRGLRGTSLGRQLLGPPRLAMAILRCRRLIRRLAPRAAVGFGGYASGAGGLAAWLARCPLVVHEQNAVAGYTNRVLARFAARVLTGFPGTLGGRGEWVGNPVREAFTRIAPPAMRYRGRGGALRLLVIGGSQGARILNETLPLAVAHASSQFEIHHLCGPDHLAATEGAYRSAGVHATVEGFSNDMAAVCSWADLAVARAGALTLAELAAAGLPVILIPFPAAVDDHQTANAQPFVAAGAARMIAQRELTSKVLAAVLDELAAAGREMLAAMGERARALARPHAAAHVAQAVLETAEKTA